jgi:tetratricopeptide (TPR) repeat protein
VKESGLMFFDVEKIEDLLNRISEIELNLVEVYKTLNDFDKALHHCEQSVYHAKQMKGGEKKTKKVFDILQLQGGLCAVMDKYAEAKASMEEAYMCVSEIYDPEHPLVLEAAGKLIMILGQTGDHYDAERFARICYETLTRAPLDRESFEAAKAATNLSCASINLIDANGPESADIEEAKLLARMAVRIIKKLKGFDSTEYAWSFGNLGEILFCKKDY